MNVTKEQWLSVVKIILVAVLAIASLLGYDLGIVEPRTQAYVNAVRPASAPAEGAPVELGAQAVEGRTIIISDTVGITADHYTQPVNWNRGSNPYTYCDIYWLIDQGTTNTTTANLQTSYDGTTWFSYLGKADPGMTDGSPAIVSANAADAGGSVTVKVQWPYMRIQWDVTNSNLITVSARLYLR